MKILMIAPQPFFEPRGTPISVFQRLEGLSKLGHTVDLVTYHLGEDVEIPGVRIHRAPKIPFVNKLKVGPSWPKVPLDILLSFKTVALLLRNRYDVIHSHEEAGMFTVPLAYLSRTPHLYDMHSSLPKQLVNFNFGDNWLFIKLFELLERLTINTSKAMITIGPDLEAHAKTINPKANQVMIENLPLRPVEGHNTAPKPDELRARLGLDGKLAVIYTGTFERYQGVDMLLESASLVKNRCDNVSFVLAGGNTQQIEEMRALANRRGLEDIVHFLGTVPVEEANQYLEMADILVSPRIEGTSVPLKIYTYLYAGKPILATNLIAHSAVLDEESGMLVEPNSEAFAEGLLTLIENPELRARLSQCARQLAEDKYSTANYLAKLEKIYRVFQPASVPQERPVQTLEN